SAPFRADGGIRPVRAYLRSGADAAARNWPGAPLIVMTHLHVEGGLGGAESERRVLIGGEEAIPLSDFPDETAYVALGHLHRPQTLKGAPLARYPGPLIPLSLDEARHEQSVSLLTFEEGAPRPTLEILPLPRPRAFHRAPERGALAPDAAIAALERLAASLSRDPDAAAWPPFIDVALRLSQPEPDLRRRVEAALGAAPALLARIRRSAAEGPIGAAETLRRAAPSAAPPTPRAVFEALHQARFDAPPSAALRRAFDRIAAAAAEATEAQEAPQEMTAPQPASSAAAPKARA
ncbi:MAG: hypothetical protein AAGM38_18840, partial [Pseudomonadota bacterium]